MSPFLHRRVLSVIGGAVALVALAPAAGSRPGTEQFFFGSPAWSHDGKRIAVSGGTRSDHGLFVMNADGSDLHKVFDTTHRKMPSGVGRLSWSPNDDRIVFSGTDPVEGYCCYYRNSLWRIGGDGLGLIRLVRRADSAAWSPGGRWVAYSRAFDTYDEYPVSAIYIIRPDGTDERLIAEPDSKLGMDYFHPAWSPDGQHLAFTVGQAWAGSAGLGIISRFGAQPRFLLRWRFVDDAAWSPSGREIAFVEGEDLNDGMISLINARTERVKRLQPGFTPTWSPDGRKIAFVRGTTCCAGSIYVMNRDGSHVRLLLRGS